MRDIMTDYSKAMQWYRGLPLDDLDEQREMIRMYTQEQGMCWEDALVLVWDLWEDGV